MFVTIDRPAPAVDAEPAGPAARPPLARRIANAQPYLYLLPALVGLAVWTYWPMVRTVQLSFVEWNLVPAVPIRPVGLSNYQQVLGLPELWEATRNTVLYIVGLLLFTVVLPLAVTLLTRRVRGRLRTFYRAAIFAPFLVAPVAAAVLWRWLLAPDGGLVNQGLTTLGLDPVNWLREPGPALVAITVIAGWQLLGFAVLVVSAGLSGISGDYAEAASVDGASRWHITRTITIPLLSPTLLFMASYTILLAAQIVFPIVDALTQGGPGDATTNLYYLLYEQAFRSFDAGLASAAGVLFFCVFAVFAVLMVRALDRWSFHDD